MTAAAGAGLRRLLGLSSRFHPGAQAARVRRLFLHAARLRPDEAAICAATGLAADPAVAEGAAGLARRTGQEPLFHHLVTRQLPHAALRDETFRDLTAHARLHALRWEDLRRCVTDLLAAFAEKGIRPVLLKGIAQAGVSYDPPHLRPMRDIDVLLREEDLEGGRRAALEAGFLADAEAHPDARYAVHHHLPPLFHAGLGICLEIHHHLMRLPVYFQGFPPLAEVWRGTRDSPLFPGRAHLLDPAMEVLATTIHITHGDTIGRRAQNLIDLARLCERDGDAIDWTRLAALGASSADVARSLAFPLLYLAGEGLPSAPAPALARIHAASGLGGWELGLLKALTHRYRIGAPLPWRFISGRLSNILWRHAFRRGPPAARAVRTFREAAAKGAA